MFEGVRLWCRGCCVPVDVSPPCIDSCMCGSFSPSLRGDALAGWRRHTAPSRTPSRLTGTGPLGTLRPCPHSSAPCSPWTLSSTAVEGSHSPRGSAAPWVRPVAPCCPWCETLLPCACCGTSTSASQCRGDPPPVPGQGCPWWVCSTHTSCAAGWGGWSSLAGGWSWWLPATPAPRGECALGPAAAGWGPGVCCVWVSRAAAAAGSAARGAAPGRTAQQPCVPRCVLPVWPRGGVRRHAPPPPLSLPSPSPFTPCVPPSLPFFPLLSVSPGLGMRVLRCVHIREVL